MPDTTNYSINILAGEDGEQVGNAHVKVEPWMGETDRAIAADESMALWASSHGYSVENDQLDYEWANW